jgi:hypothetical protein
MLVIGGYGVLLVVVAFAFAQVCHHPFDLDDKAILLIMIVFLLLQVGIIVITFVIWMIS